MKAHRPHQSSPRADNASAKSVILALVAVAVATTACDLHAQRSNTSEANSAKVQALVQKTLQRLSFVPAGGFWLGDPGLLMTDKLKESGVALGPDAKVGDNPGYTPGEDNKPPRWVTLDAYSIQQLKVTYDDFDTFVAANSLPAHPPKGEEPYQRIWQDARTGGDVPAGVNWAQAKAYCQWLAKITALPFDLPTEAQWEFAASAGRKTHKEPMPTDNGLLEEGRNIPSHAQKKQLIGSRGVLYPVGRFPASRSGLHDLVGNGLEWVHDWYAKDTYAGMKITHNPAGPATGSERVLRGAPADEGLGFSGFPHVDRYHQPAEGKQFKDGRPIPYAGESFRCVVNRAEPVSPSSAGGAAASSQR